MSITLLTLLLSAALSLAALPPDFRLDEHPVYGPAQQPSLGLTLLGYSLSVDPVDGLHYITGGVPAGVPQIAVSAAIYGAKASDKTAFSQEATFVPPPGYTGTLDFGTAVDIFGDYAVVSSPSSLFSDATLGHVFVYRRQGATWAQQSPSVIGNPLIDQCKFGTSLALFGTQLIVGCTGLAGVYNDTVSAAFLFNVTDGTLLNTFTPTQAPLLRFAQAVEITATHAFVSQPLANNTGAVHIFDLTNGLNYTVIDGSNFGRSLAAENGSVLAGGYGYAHLLAFNSTTNDFEIEATFLPVATSRGDFGRDVAFSGRRVLIGNPYSTGKVQASGSVQVHFKDPDTESWGPGILVGASDGLPAAQYGLSVALSADQIFVGAIGGYCQTCIAYTPGVVYVYNQANSCGTPPIEDSPTVCSTLGQLLYFNPDLKVTKPVILTNPIVFIGNVSIGANVTVFISNNDTTSPITGLSCVGVTDGSLNVELTSPVDGNVVVINSRCVSGQFNGVVLKPRADDCRAYTVTGQTRDPATGSLTLLLKVDKSGCGSNLARKRGIIAGAVVGGVLLIAGLVLLFFFIGYKLHWRFLDSVFNKREDPTIVHI